MAERYEPCTVECIGVTKPAEGLRLEPAIYDRETAQIAHFVRVEGRDDVLRELREGKPARPYWTSASTVANLVIEGTGEVPLWT